MPPGPPPTPTKVLKLRGSWRARRNPSEPKGDNRAPSCPSWLDAEGKKAWRYVVPILQKRGTISSEDQHALAIYCGCWSRYRLMVEAIQEHGVVMEVVSKHGEVHDRARPEHRIMMDLTKTLRAYQHEFGLTPSARSRIGVASAPASRGSGSKFF